MRHAFRDALVRLGALSSGAAASVWLRPAALPLPPLLASTAAVLHALGGKGRGPVLVKGVVAAAAPQARVLYAYTHVCSLCGEASRIEVGWCGGSIAEPPATACRCGGFAPADGTRAEYVSRARIWLVPAPGSPAHASRVDAPVLVDVLDYDLIPHVRLGAAVVVAGVAEVATAKDTSAFAALRLVATNVWPAPDWAGVGAAGLAVSHSLPTSTTAPALGSLLSDLRAAGAGLAAGEAALLALLLSAATGGAVRTVAGRAQVHVRVPDAWADPSAARGLRTVAAVLAGDAASCPLPSTHLLPATEASGLVQAGALLCAGVVVLEGGGAGLAPVERSALAAALGRGWAVPTLPAVAAKVRARPNPGIPLTAAVWAAGEASVEGRAAGPRAASADAALDAAFDVVAPWFEAGFPVQDDAAFEGFLCPPPADLVAAARLRAHVVAAAAAPLPTLGPAAASALHAHFVAIRAGGSLHGAPAAASLARLASACARLHGRPCVSVLPDVALAVALRDAGAPPSHPLVPPVFGPLASPAPLDVRLAAVAAALAKLDGGGAGGGWGGASGAGSHWVGAEE